MKARRLISKLLICFVLVSIGFALGKEAGRRRAKPGAVSQAASQRGAGDKVVVYYLHATIRCFTCNQLEMMTERLLRTDFASELRDGRIEWRQADFQLRDDLAKRYDVVSSTVVLVKLRDGKEVEFRRLDEVWTLVHKPDEFNALLTRAIRGYLQGNGP